MIKARGALGDVAPDNARRGAVDQAQRHIASLLDLGQVRPGGRLPPASALATDIGVSRPAVLQALKLLAAEGRVVVRPGRGGTWAVGTDADNLGVRRARAWDRRDTIIQMAHLREMVEPGAARLAAARGVSAKLLAHARRLTEQMGETPFEDRDEYRALDTEFHLLIAHATGMRLIESYVIACRREVAAVFDVMEVPRSRKVTSDAEHAELLDAIEARNPAAAAAVAHEHVAHTTLWLEGELRRRRPDARSR